MESIQTNFNNLSPEEQLQFLERLRDQGVICGSILIPELFSPNLSVIEKMISLGMEFFIHLYDSRDSKVYQVVQPQQFVLNRYEVFQLIMYYGACQYRGEKELSKFDPFTLENIHVREILAKISNLIISKYIINKEPLPISAQGFEQRHQKIIGTNYQNARVIKDIVIEFKQKYNSSMSEDEVIELLFNIINEEYFYYTDTGKIKTYFDLELLFVYLDEYNPTNKVLGLERLRSIDYCEDINPTEYRYVHDFGNNKLRSSKESVYKFWRKNFDKCYGLFSQLHPIILMAYNEKLIAEQYGISHVGEVDKIEIIDDGNATLFIPNQIHGMQYEHSQLVFFAIHTKVVDLIVMLSREISQKDDLHNTVESVKSAYGDVKKAYTHMGRKRAILQLYEYISQFIGEYTSNSLSTKAKRFTQNLKKKVKQKVLPSKNSIKIDTSHSILFELESFINSMLAFYGLNNDDRLLVLLYLQFYQGNKAEIRREVQNKLLDTFASLSQNAPDFYNISSEIFVPSK